MKDSSNIKSGNRHWVCQPWIKPDSIIASGTDGSNVAVTLALSHWSFLESNGQKVAVDFLGILFNFYSQSWHSDFHFTESQGDNDTLLLFTPISHRCSYTC